jgi:hypothetical protein
MLIIDVVKGFVDRNGSLRQAKSMLQPHLNCKRTGKIIAITIGDDLKRP